jgi:spermidine synthase
MQGPGLDAVGHRGYGRALMKPWRTIETSPTDDGEEEGALELRQRGDDEFLITVGGRVLMNSTARSSEEALSTLAAAELAGRRAPRVLIGGLGMGFTLRAALDAFPADARVTVAELNPVVLAWCRGPLAPSTRNAVGDPRVRVELGDVARVIAEAPKASFDAILLDLYEGPNTAYQGRDSPFYGPAALVRTKAAIAPGGVLGVWSEDADAPFVKRFSAAGFAVTTHRVGRGGRKHVVYLGRR